MLVKTFLNERYKEYIKEIIISILPVFLLLFSLNSYLNQRSNYQFPPLQAGESDPGDYRYLAEIFWKVPHYYPSYHPVFSHYWGNFLEHVHFRQLGVGTFYLFFTSPTGASPAGASPAGASPEGGALTELLQHTSMIPIVLICLLSISYLIFFSACRSRWGSSLALFAFICLVSIPHIWAQTEELLTEPFLRIILVNILSLVILLENQRALAVKVGLIYLLLFLAVHCKSQWLLYGFLLFLCLGLFLFSHKHYRLLLASSILALFLPLSLLLVNLAGWGYPALTPGLGLHINLKTEGALVEYITARLADDNQLSNGRKPAFLKGENFDSFWRIRFDYTPQESSWRDRSMMADYQLLDKYANEYMLTHWQTQLLQPLLQGLIYTTNFPAGIWGNSPYVQPPLGLRLLDLLTVLVLVTGFFFRRTWLLATAALGLWLLPVAGTVFSVYVTRYHRPMAMLPLAVAFIIAVLILDTILSGIYARKRLEKIY
jgi:hypothetical protein